MLGVILIQLKFVLVPFLLAIMAFMLLQPLVDMMTHEHRWCKTLCRRQRTGCCPTWGSLWYVFFFLHRPVQAMGFSHVCLCWSF